MQIHLSRQAVFVALAVAFVSIVTNWTKGPVANEAADLETQHLGESKFQVRATGCQTVIAGTAITLSTGQTINAGNDWQTCEAVDGHPVIVHSSKPPQARSTQ